MKKSALSTSELKLTNNMDASNGNISGALEEDTIIQLHGLGSNDFTLMEDDVIKPLSAKDQIKKFGGWIKHKIKRSCTKKMLYRRIPILTWLPKYNCHDAIGDFVAGLTVGLTVIPQALAYSSIAGLPAQPPCPDLCPLADFADYTNKRTDTHFCQLLNPYVSFYASFGLNNPQSIQNGDPGVYTLCGASEALYWSCKSCGDMKYTYGLYGSFLGAFLYIIFGSCKDVPMGPTAIVALLTYQATHGLKVEHAILLCFISGLIQIFMGILGLGFMVDFVSGPVSSGFTSAVALLIVTSQVKDLLGIKAVGGTFIEMWISLFGNITNTRLWDTVLGFGCIIILLCMRLLASLELGPKDPSKKTCAEKVITKIFWTIGTSRNAILVVLCALLGYYFVNQKEMEHFASENSTTTERISPTEEAPFLLTGYIPQGLPEVKIPPFGFESEGKWVSFVNMISDLRESLIILPVIGLLENIAICKVFSSGKPVDATQELLAIGICNVGNSFVQSFPGSGSLSRSAVNEASGVRTPLGGLYTGAIVIVALLFFTPYVYYIPKATLAAVIVAAVVFMIEVKVVKPMWRTKKSDLIPGFGTFIACLVLKLEYGIFLGILIQILFLLYNAARPKIHMQKITTKSGIEYLRLTPDRCLIFPSVDYVRNIVTKHSIKQGIPVVIDCSHIYGADFTAAKVIQSMSRDFVQRKQPLLFYNLKESVVEVFEGLQLEEFVTFYEHDDLDELLKRKVYEKANS